MRVSKQEAVYEHAVTAEFNAGKGVSKEPEASLTRCCVEVSISLRALVPNLSAASAAIAIRMAERWNRYEQYSSYWQVRPRVSRSLLLRGPAVASM